jgi:hypothetical protein
VDQTLWIVVDRHGRTPFDAERIRRVIGQLDGVFGWREDAARPGEFSCQLGGCTEGHFPITIRLLDELRCVTIGAYCHLGLDAALSIQRGYGEPLFAFSEESSPDMVELATVATPEELSQRLGLRA